MVYEAGIHRPCLPDEEAEVSESDLQSQTQPPASGGKRIPTPLLGLGAVALGHFSMLPHISFFPAAEVKP